MKLMNVKKLIKLVFFIGGGGGGGGGGGQFFPANPLSGLLISNNWK